MLTSDTVIFYDTTQKIDAMLIQW